MFFRHSENGKVTILIVYMDDIILIEIYFSVAFHWYWFCFIWIIIRPSARCFVE